MCIYCETSNYRKIYENHHGIIPKDETGRSYHIHHIDGNRKNNSPENLIAVSVFEHYKIHYDQGDWYAAARLASIINIPHSVRSDITRMQGTESYKNRVNGLYDLNKSKQDPTVYHWQNLDTGEVIFDTIHNLAKRIGQKAGALTRVVSGNLKSFKKWRLFSEEKYERTTTHRKYNPIIHKWNNVYTNEYVEATISEMAKKCEDTGSQYFSAVVCGRKKTRKGWRVVK